MIMSSSRIEIYIDITLFDGVGKCTNTELSQHLNTLVNKKLFPMFGFCSGLNIETIQQFCACFMLEIIETPIWLWR